MLWGAVFWSLGSSAPQAAPCPLPGLGAVWVLCAGLVPGGQRGGGGRRLPSAPFLGCSRAAASAGARSGSEPPSEGNSSLMQAPGLWLDPTSSLSLLLFSPEAFFTFVSLWFYLPSA